MTRLSDQQVKQFTEILKDKGILTSKQSYIPIREQNGMARLSFAQQRIWLFEQLNPGNTAYLIHTGVRIKGHLNYDALCFSIKELVKRHDMLRTTFKNIDGQPMQIMDPDIIIEPEVIDITEFDSNSVQHEIKKYSRQETIKPFNLSSEPLMRVKILKISPTNNIMFITIHHIISDSWSLDIMLKEVAVLYDGYINQKLSYLPENKIQYADYAEWQHKLNWDSQISYWTNKLRNAPHVSELPTDFPRTEIQEYNGGLYRFQLSNELTYNIRKYCKQNNVTQYMFFLAAFNVLIMRYTGQDDILIGTPIAGREHANLENLVGMFVNTTVIRTRLIENMTFKQLVNQTKETTLEAFENGSLPFDKLIEKIAPKRDNKRSPLFQIMFMMQESAVHSFNMHNLKIYKIDTDYGTSLFDLSLAFKLEQDCFLGVFEYNSNLFQENSIQRLQQHLINLLNQICVFPDKPVVELPFLTQAELQYNEKLELTHYEQNKNIEGIHKIFEKQVINFPNHVAITNGEESFTYEVLNNKANQLAHYIRRNEKNTGNEIGIMLGHRLDTVIAVLAVLKAGYKYIPIDVNAPMERISIILENHEDCLVITTSEYSSVLETLGVNFILTSPNANEIDNESLENLELNTFQNDACVIYTSGSTGKPKGVKLSHRGLINVTESFINSYNVTPKDRILPLSSVASASFVGEIFPMLCVGGSIALFEHDGILDVENLYNRIGENDITIISTVPSFIRYLNQHQHQIPLLRLILSGGEPLYFSDIYNLINEKTIVNGYGLTETTICSTYYIISKEDSKIDGPLPIGIPIQNTQVYILDRNRNIMPFGCIGEIYISGSGISMGYINDNELNDKRFIEHPFIVGEKIFRTGDLGRRMSDGKILFIGREDYQVKIRGYRVEPNEIEACLQHHSDIQKALVIIKEEDKHEKVISAFIQTKSGQDIELNGLRNWLRDRLPEYMVPTRYLYLEEFPIGVNGKVDIQKLMNSQSYFNSSNDVLEEAGTLIEQKIAEIWKEALSIEKVGINQNFFDIGGHSLMLISLMLRIKNEIYSEIKIVDLFKYPTIASLSNFLDNEHKDQFNETNSILERVAKQKAMIKKRHESIDNIKLRWRDLKNDE